MVYCTDKDMQRCNRFCTILVDDRVADGNACPCEERETRAAAIHGGGHGESTYPIAFIQADSETQDTKQPFLDFSRDRALNDLL